MHAIPAAIAAFLLASLPVLAHDGVHVEDAYARTSSQSGAVFLRVINHADEDDRLIAVTTDAAARAELHTHDEDANGVMKMGKVAEGFVIPALREHILGRGGDHIMLMGLTRPLQNGDVISLTLTFQRSGDVVITVPVDNGRKDGVAGSHSHSHTTTP